ncbi:GNAT family N-acetyltransferase [Laceyella putida]|uniref:GNAT family N-acetyltransferase n=1 Tax=Laceyella putida TaxID=110101 RepID=A0ABW2RN59_9BACL
MINMIQPSAETENEFVKSQLIQYNLHHVPAAKEKPYQLIGYHIKDEAGTIIGGICGVLYWGRTCLQIDILWLHESYRKQGLGSALLRRIEQEAVAREVHLAHLETFDFQAKDFYIKNGYEVFGVLEDCPIGHERYYLKKKL